MSTFYAPVINALYTGMYALFGISSWIYFGVGICVHACVSAVVGFITRILTRSSLAGMIAVILFVIAGGGYEPIVWIGANMHSIAVLCIVLSSWFLLEAYQTSRTRMMQYIYLVASVGTCMLAFGTKEIAISTPGVLALIIIVLYQRKMIDRYAGLVVYTLSVIALTSIYGWFQYLWQRDSMWVSNRVFSFDIFALFRIPITLFDTLVPLGWMINASNAVVFLCIATSFFLYVLYKFRTQTGVWLGSLWALGALAPVIFFNVSAWWQPLASRYTYHVRVGMVVLLASLFVSLIRDNRYIRTAHRFVWILIAAMVCQVVFMGVMVQKEYPYVYRTGRTLVSALESVDTTLLREDAHVFVEPFRPFEANHAHIVGVLDILLDIPEERIVFVEDDPNTLPSDGDLILSWDGRLVSYVVHFSDEQAYSKH